jgi:hypothetical protein
MSQQKKNNRQGSGSSAGLSRRRSGGVLTTENTNIQSVLSSQVESYVQGDLLKFKVLQFDLFGYESAGGWYD